MKNLVFNKNKKLFAVLVKWDYDYGSAMSGVLKRSIRSSNPPVKNFFNRIISKRTSYQKVKFTWRSTSEVLVEKVPEKKLMNFIQKLEEISNRFSFTRISKVEIVSI
ncbi:hypothetical protein ACXGQW_02700 [Wenyingzhuangia sp. IMCC45533]